MGKLVYKAAAATDRGRKRSANEDAFGYSVEDGVFVVCDGMGGAAAGEVASRMAVDRALERLTGLQMAGQQESSNGSGNGSVSGSSNRSLNGFANGPANGFGTEVDRTLTSEQAANALREAVSAANGFIHDYAKKDARLHGMGTTLVVMLVRDDRAWLAHVGDSRCYKFRNGVLEQMTQDHSLVEEQVRLGRMSPGEALRSPLRNVITRAVGSQQSVAPDVQEFAVEAGDRFLVCTDGLTRELGTKEVARVLAEEPEMDRACERLIAAANKSGGRDNITCLVVRVEAADALAGL